MTSTVTGSTKTLLMPTVVSVTKHTFSNCIALVWLTQLRIKRISLPFDTPSIVLSAVHNSGSMGMTLTSNPIVVTQGEVNHDAVNSGKEASTGGLYIYDYVRSTDIESAMTRCGPSALDYDTISDTPPVKVSIVHIRTLNDICSVAHVLTHRSYTHASLLVICVYVFLSCTVETGATVKALLLQV